MHISKDEFFYFKDFAEDFEEIALDFLLRVQRIKKFIDAAERREKFSVIYSSADASAARIKELDEKIAALADENRKLKKLSAQTVPPSRVKLPCQKSKSNNVVNNNLSDDKKSGLSAACEDLQLNKKTEKCESVKKEDESMPYLKDLHYRKTLGGHQYRYRRHGLNKTFYSKNKEIAKSRAYAFVKGLNEQTAIQAEKARGVLLDNVAGAWLDLKKLHVVPKTWAVYNGIYKNHIAPVFGKRAVKSILPMHLQPFFNDLFTRQEKTCEDAKIILNGVFNYAVANRLCPSNPMCGVIIEKHYRKNGVALTAAELAEMKDAIKNSEIETAVLIVLYSGVRTSELKTIFFDWKRGEMTIKNAKLKKSQKRNPANIFRTVPIFPAIWELRDKIESSDGWRMNETTFQIKFAKFWGKNTITDLRHTFTTYARQCVENELVNVWTGHAPGKNLTANTYTHFSSEYQQNAAKLIKPY